MKNVSRKCSTNLPPRIFEENFERRGENGWIEREDVPIENGIEEEIRDRSSFLSLREKEQEEKEESYLQLQATSARELYIRVYDCVYANVAA